MTYIFGFMVNAVLATALAGLASAVAAALPARGKRARTRIIPAAATFTVVWFSAMLFGCISMFSTHKASLSKVEAAGIAPGLGVSAEHVVQAEQIYGGDTSTSYVLVRITEDEVRNFAKMSRMTEGPFTAHTDKDRGWSTPEWWPTQPCPSGLTYRDDPSVSPRHVLNYVINWCPASGRAYIMKFDY